MSTSEHAGAEQEPARRQTPTERLHEVTMAALHRKPAEPESMVELTRNAKGDVQIAVTVRGFDLAELERLAGDTYDRLAAAYPRGAEANGGAA